MNKSALNKILVYAGIALLFLVIAYAYVPQVLSGKIVNQSDISGWTGMAQEMVEHNNAHPDDKTLWTNSMFGGMPTVSIHADFKGDWTKAIYDFLLTGARPATYLFLSLIGGFLLMLSFGVNKVLAIAGAIAITFCSYNMQIIQVGHNTKMQAIAYMPWVLAALVFTYRCAMSGLDEKVRNWLPKTVFGAVLFAFALSFQIKANHPQITYYLAIVIFIYALALLIWTLSSKERRRHISRFFAASTMLLVIGCVGIATNLNKLLPTYEYAEYSMRGGSELNKGDDSKGDDSKGLELDYATAWSYGIEETPNLLIPNFNGGATYGDPRLKDSEVRSLLQNAGQPYLDEIMKSLLLYWGPQPFTAGPMYMGAISVFLFILGLFLLKGRDKWWIAIATLLAIFLAWGSHFMWFTKLWYDYAPMYNKFRTVSMALVILQMTLPLLGILVVDKIWKGQIEAGKVRKGLLASYIIAGGFCLVFAIFPGLAGTFSGSADQQYYPDMIIEAVRLDRRAMLVKDAFRSFVFITLAAALIYYSITSKSMTSGKTGHAAVGVCLCLLIVLDLVPVDRRYLNGEHFVSKREFTNQFTEKPVDKMILQDPALDYRVLDISVNTFNDSHASYRHKSIGGYSPAKIQRYQDLIDHYLLHETNLLKVANNSGNISAALGRIPVTSLLNGKYIIVDGNQPPVVNPDAFGNCWIVSSAVPASGPDEEIALIGQSNLRDEAVIGDDFAWARERLDSLSNLARYDIAPADSIWMTSYAPNELKYRSRFNGEQAVVFSEIYYPAGWKMTIDGKPAEIFRADWILRGAFIPAGEHEIVMRFDPQSFKTGERLSRASSILLVLLLLLSGAGLCLNGRASAKH